MIPLESAVRIIPLDEDGAPATTTFGLPSRLPRFEQWTGAGRLVLEYGPHIWPWRVGDDDEMTGAGAWPTH